MGKSTSRIVPYTPNISRKCASLTFFVSFSTTIFELRGGGGLLRAGLRLLLLDGLRDGLLDRDSERGVIDRLGVAEGDLEAIEVSLTQTRGG